MTSHETEYDKRLRELHEATAALTEAQRHRDQPHPPNQHALLDGAVAAQERAVGVAENNLRLAEGRAARN